MENLLDEYISLKKQKNDISEQMLEIEKKVYAANASKLDFLEGTFSSETERYKIKVTKKLTTKVDQKLASKLDFGFKVERKFSKTEFNKLSDEQKSQVEDCLIQKNAKPSFSFELKE